MTSASNISASHTASEIIQLAKHIRRMGVSTVVIGSNIIRPTPRNMKETTYDRKKKKINKELNKVKESDIKYWRHQSSCAKGIFSQVKLVKCDHINRMKQVTMNNILHVKLNCNKQCYEHVSDTVVAKFFRVNDRKIELYLG